MRWRSGRGRGRGSVSLPTNTFNSSLNTKVLPYYDTLLIQFDTPVDTSHCRLDSTVVVMRLADSTSTSCNVLLNEDLMSARIPYPFRQGEKYDVNILSGMFYDIYGRGADSLHAVISVTKAEDYGNLSIKLEPDDVVEGLLIVQLLNESEKVVDSSFMMQSGTVEFKHLKPGKYRIRTLFDENGNRRWDTGDFASSCLPERVVYYEKTLDVRANWDFEEVWKLKKQ